MPLDSIGSVLVVAIAGLLYALMLMGQVKAADNGTPKMQAIADAVREGANAYLKRQLTTVAVLIAILVVVLYVTKALSSDLKWADPFALGRAGAFLVGAIFSGTVGFVGMRLATTGNLKVAAAAPVGFGKALMLGYRTGTITGMLTDGLGLLGGTLIFMTYGEHAYEALLGFGFGGTLLALFMRVGGGIYTKAADVGADLVGKVEAGIPEDDPRNAATIADNVGDNVGDCAGMAADIFESYEVTIVAAMILGFVAFGHKGVMFPILVRAIGVVGSIVSTYSVKAGDRGNVAEAMKSINFGFILGSIISVVGFMLLGWFYLHFSGPAKPELGAWVTFGQVTQENGVWTWLDMRPAYTCLIGILLCIALNRRTEYFTGTEYSPVKGMVRNCTTGHATNIIEGFAVGYESAVVTAIILGVAIMASVLVYAGTNPICIAYGVAMCGIGMLTLTGNTISMDVFGPVADNANGIGEMGYEKERMHTVPAEAGKEEHERKYKEARQILADLDAVGNTTKAVTKGVAIGSAVIAAVSLFASFIAVIAVGSEDKIVEMAVKRVLEQMYEPLLLECSYGYREGRSPHQCIDAIGRTIQQKRLIKRMLMAGIMEDGLTRASEEGAPQGAIVSPVLSNVYLHYALDLWFEKRVKPHAKGEAHLFRFADDFLGAFQFKEEGQSFERNLKDRVEGFNLEIAPEKTRRMEYGPYATDNAKRRGEKSPAFTFLGLTHYCGKTRNGHFKVKRHTSVKKFRAKLREYTAWIRNSRGKMPTGELMRRARSRLQGYLNYYAITDNFKACDRYRHWFT